MHACLGRQIGKRRLQRHAEVGIRDHPPARGQCRVGEVDRAAEEIEIRGSDVLFGGGKSQLRAVVGRNQRIERIGLQRLPALHQRRETPRATVPPGAVFRQRALARQHGLRGRRDLRRQIGEIRVVRDFLNVQVPVPAVVPKLIVTQIQRKPAGVVLDAVRGNDFVARLAGVSGIQITELVAQHHAAL